MNSSRYEFANSATVVNTERFRYEEIVCLLNACEKYNIISQSQLKGYSLVRAFTPVHNELTECGYNRSLTQVIDKFRKLKLRYVHSYLSRKKGKTAMANRFEHFKRFEKMLENSKVDIELFIKKASKKDECLETNSSKYEIFKEDNNSNTVDYENIEELDVLLDDSDSYVIEKEGTIEEECDNDEMEDQEDYSSENTNIKFVPNMQPSTPTSDTKEMTPSERTVLLLEQLIPNFKRAQQELQVQFFRQQRELQRQQQEWEERILDEEREFFTKVLSNLNKSNQ